MYCEACAYKLGNPGNATCRRCGRYTPGKTVEISLVAAAALSVALVSRYILAGGIFEANRLLWLKSGFTVPGSIYGSRLFAAGALLTVSCLLVLPVLAAFHYGARWGLLIAAGAGFVSGLHVGAPVLALLAAVASVPRMRKIPAAGWPALAALIGGGYLLYLWWDAGPENPLYSRSLLAFVAASGALALVFAAAEAAVTVRLRGRSFQIVPAALVAALAVAALTLGTEPPSRMEANMVLTLYDPDRILKAPLPEGFAVGLSTTDDAELVPEKQVGNVLKTVELVDRRRAAAAMACDEYLSRFPGNPPAARILLLKADMLNARVDLPKLKRFNRLECYFDRIAEGALGCYEEVAARFPGSPEAALAQGYLAEGKFQAGNIQKARRLYQEAAAKLCRFSPDEPPEVPESPRTLADLFDLERRRELRRRRSLYETCALVRRRISLIDENSDYGQRPLARLAALDARAGDFTTRAGELLADYPQSLVADNVRLLMTEKIADPLERLQALKNLYEKNGGSDVRDRILFNLARAHLNANLDGAGTERAELALRRLLSDHPESTYAPRAKRLLENITARAN